MANRQENLPATQIKNIIQGLSQDWTHTTRKSNPSLEMLRHHFKMIMCAWYQKKVCHWKYNRSERLYHCPQPCISWYHNRIKTCYWSISTNQSKRDINGQSPPAKTHLQERKSSAELYHVDQKLNTMLWLTSLFIRLQFGLNTISRRGLILFLDAWGL